MKVADSLGRGDLALGDDTEPPNPLSGTDQADTEPPGPPCSSPAPGPSWPDSAQTQTTVTDLFRQRHFGAVPDSSWNNWRWQIRNRITSLEGLSRFLDLSPEELQAGSLPLAITPYYLSLIDPQDPGHPLRRTVVPRGAERLVGFGESADPLSEDEDSPAPNLVHRYPDRVLLLATDFCSTYCRYCTRSRMVGRRHAPGQGGRLDQALAYIEAHPEIRDVLISGGDPLTLTDAALERLLSRLRAIRHLEIIRLGTKVPAVLPQRITPALVRMLKRFHPLFISLHFAHPAELTPEAARACARLADAGIPLGSQTVLLAGVNDDPATMTSLVQGLLRCRVRPYYLYQCDPTLGSAHFRTPVKRGLEIIESLRGHTTGYAVPTYVIDAPGGGGKIPLQPNYLLGREENGWRLRNYEDRTFTYPEPGGGRLR